MRESLSKLLKSEFYRNIFSLFTGLFVSRLLPVLFAFAIVRIYSPDDFGFFVFFLTIASALSIISTGKFENAIILAEENEEKKHLFSLAMKINGMVNGLVLILLLIYYSLADNSLQQLWMLVPVYSYFFAAIQLQRHVLIREKQFRKLSLLEIARAFVTGLLQVGLFSFPATGLFWGASLANAIVFVWYHFRKPGLHWPRTFRFSNEEQQLARRYLNFPKFSIVSELLNFLSSQLPIFILKPFFGSTALGWYALPHRYLNIPVQLFSNSISRVYVREAQALQSQPEQLSALTYSLFRKQVLIGIIPFSVMGLWGESLFQLFFGAEWAFSGFLAQLIVPWLFAVSISSPLSAILIVREKQRASMIFNIALFLCRAFSLLAGVFWINDLTWTIGFYSFTGFIFFIGLGIYSLKLAGVKRLPVLLFVFKILALTLIPLALVKIWI
ncbi:oligosaccharide flippase family protein [Mangrovibacterium sp.]|uniref:oligosaccharide flippase family protein n=1 Tax=Mangrovibacterium sp. TaxID=1961364 RepID=UPI00356511C6